jgi:hypothetical protein
MVSLIVVQFSKLFQKNNLKHISKAQCTSCTLDVQRMIRDQVDAWDILIESQCDYILTSQSMG